MSEERSPPAATPDAGLRRDVTLEFGAAPRWRRRMTLQTIVRGAALRPPWLVGKAPGARPTWLVYFAYAPGGQPGPAQIDSLCRLRDDGWPVLLVIATSDPGNLSPQWFAQADAWVWKGLAGYDFSAYTIALELLARASPGARVAVVNDSVFGPIRPLAPLFAGCTAGLAGLTGSGSPEPHVQSYAFQFRDWSSARLGALRSVFWRHGCLTERDDVILAQELRLARASAASMSVSAIWYAERGDPTQRYPLELVAQGMPFIKKSLLHERSSFADKASIEALLDAHRIPWRPAQVRGRGATACDGGRLQSDT